MDKQQTLQQLQQLGLVAVLRGPSPELTLRMVEALVAGGVRAIEITYTTPDAAAVVDALDARFGDAILLGMGTLTGVEQAAEARDAGARFLVSPVCEEALTRAMAATGRLTMAGALTPTEVLRAYGWGSDVVKLFPGSLGGPSFLKSLREPFPHIPLMPTGGVSASNVGEWFAAGAVAVGAGSSLCPKPLVLEERWEELTARAQAFVVAVAQAQGQ